MTKFTKVLQYCQHLYTAASGEIPKAVEESSPSIMEKKIAMAKTEADLPMKKRPSLRLDMESF